MSELIPNGDDKTQKGVIVRQQSNAVIAKPLSMIAQMGERTQSQLMEAVSRYGNLQALDQQALTGAIVYVVKTRATEPYHYDVFHGKNTADRDVKHSFTAATKNLMAGGFSDDQIMQIVESGLGSYKSSYEHHSFDFARKAVGIGRLKGHMEQIVKMIESTDGWDGFAEQSLELCVVAVQSGALEEGQVQRVAGAARYLNPLSGYIVAKAAGIDGNGFTVNGNELTSPKYEAREALELALNYGTMSVDEVRALGAKYQEKLDSAGNAKSALDFEAGKHKAIVASIEGAIANHMKWLAESAMQEIDLSQPGMNGSPKDLMDLQARMA